MLNALAALTGSVLGFIAGLFFAFLADLHEPLHVFAPAVFVGGLFGASFLWCASRFLPRLQGWHKVLAEVSLVVGAFVALVLFLQVIG